MDLAVPMGNLAPKLLQLLQYEYKLQKGVKTQVECLAKELKSMHLALCEVARVPYDQLNPQVKLWASQAREASYDMEDILDTFLVRVDSCHQPIDAEAIVGAIENIKKQVDEMAKRFDRHKVDVVANSSTTTIDPHVLMTLGTKASELVGIDEPRDALIHMLTLGDDYASFNKMKIVSVVGSGGLGKTTLAKVVYEKLTVDLNIYCKAFVPVGRNPDLKKVFRDILIDLDKTWYMNITNLMILDERQLIEQIQAFLKEKRYFVVIDDIWEVRSWKAIRIALEDNNLRSKIMLTTRCNDVAELVRCTYKIQPLHPDSSKILFYGRIFGSQDQCSEIFSELSDKILKKCDGVPLAITTIASLLANKSYDIIEWQEVCRSIGSGLSSSNDMYNDMRKILSLSYYDLPSHMKTCFLYLSMYPEEYEINRDQLIWRWISEGFIQPPRRGDDLFEVGKSYFNDLINRNLVQPVVDYMGEIYAFRVHDMILDLICFLSIQENLVTTSDHIDQVMTSSESKKLRRLSLKNTTWPEQGVSQVRSIAVFCPFIDSMPSFSCLDMLRVLDLKGCYLRDRGGSGLYIGNLIHLRYLGLRGTGLPVLPEGIEKLQFLQVFNMDGNMELPESFFGLRRLMCLEGVHCCPRLGNLLRNQASLKVLDSLYLDKDPKGTVEALGHLTRLTVLSISIMTEMVDQRICDDFMNSLGNLPRLQSLQIWQLTQQANSLRWERWAPPPQLRVVRGIFSRTLPEWISPAWLPHLTSLCIKVDTVRPEDIQILSTLPSLVDLNLSVAYQNYLELPLQKFVVSADAFPCLRRCIFHYVAAVPSMFTPGAMPLLKCFQFYLRAKDFIPEAEDGFDFNDLAMDHLPSLQEITCGVTGVTGKKLEDALKQAADVHPNHPKLRFC